MSMRLRPSSVLLAGLILVGLPALAQQKTGARGVSRVSFQGWNDCLKLESRDTPASAVVLPAVGGRVVAYGIGEDNLLWLNPDTLGKSLPAEGAGFDPGGFYCDIGPEVAGLAPHPGLQSGPWEWSARKNYLVLLRAPEEKTLGVELEREVMFDPSSGDLGFQHRMKNTGDRECAYCFWHRIQLRPGGHVLLPLHRKSRFANGWSLQKTLGSKLTWEAGQTPPDSVRILDGILVARTGDTPSVKIGVDSDTQWAAYVTGKTLFVVHFPYYSTAIYSEGGNSVVVSWDARRTELQPMAPEARLRTRKSYDFPIKWSLIELPAEVTTPEQARALVEKIPASPFL